MSDPTQPGPDGGLQDNQTPLNSQALQAADELRRLVAGNPDKLAGTGLALAIAQTAAIALQDAADHQRRVQIMTEATYAKALGGAGGADAQGMIEAAAKASLAASELLSKSGDVALEMLEKLAAVAK